MKPAPGNITPVAHASRAGPAPAATEAIPAAWAVAKIAARRRWRARVIGPTGLSWCGTTIERSCGSSAGARLVDLRLVDRRQPGRGERREDRRPRALRARCLITSNSGVSAEPVAVGEQARGGVAGGLGEAARRLGPAVLVDDALRRLEAGPARDRSTFMRLLRRRSAWSRTDPPPCRRTAARCGRRSRGRRRRRSPCPRRISTPAMRAERPPSSTSTSPMPHTAGRPMPRATTAAWLVRPPLPVTTATLAMKPCTSVGEVVGRTRTTLRPSSAIACARAASNATSPTAPPGEDASPRAITSASGAASAKRGRARGLELLVVDARRPPPAR